MNFCNLPEGWLVEEQVTLSEEDYQAAKTFSIKVFPTMQETCKNRSQTNEKRIKSQTLDGKLGELAVYRVLAKLGITCEYPDMEVHKKSDKSFSPDTLMQYKGSDYRLSIKTSTRPRSGNTRWISTKEGLVVDKPQHSYMVQLSNKEGGGGCDNGTYDYYAVCNKNSTHTFTFVGLLRSDLFDLLRCEPFAPELKKRKAVVFEHHLRDELVNYL